MAQLLGGILGKTKNKVGNIVTASWKGINYARSYVIPANPRTSAQQQQRNYLKQAVELGRGVFSLVVRDFWNYAVQGRNTSGWAEMIRRSLNGIRNVGNPSGLVVADGNLQRPGSYLIRQSDAQRLEFVWDVAVYGNGRADDQVYFVVFVPELNSVQVFSGAERDDGGNEALLELPLRDGMKVYGYMTLQAKNNVNLWSSTMATEVTWSI